ncbi:alpha/beta hydrolase [Caballeronia ptereochthonis]|uniref:alpha/beta hydrolase n=1 Tax=Caballeronia ptereochthonis TaxID=1777144 RepID=UPI001FC936BE|nr:alpha/beta hydrolase fold domain-containing protein [Caballeronia ptereochthonis]
MFDAIMERVLPYNGVTFESGSVGGIPGLWVNPENCPPDEAILHLHRGWFNFGSAFAFRHLVAQIAARSGVKAFVPDYRLAPEHPFSAAPDDVLACYLVRKPIRSSCAGARLVGHGTRIPWQRRNVEGFYTGSRCHPHVPH